jgi:hypothetical protein
LKRIFSLVHGAWLIKAWNAVSTAQAIKMPEAFEGHVNCILAEARLSDNDAQIHKPIVSRIDNVRTEDKNEVIQTRERRDWQDCPQTKKVRDYAVQSQPNNTLQ